MTGRMLPSSSLGVSSLVAATLLWAWAPGPFTLHAADYLGAEVVLKGPITAFNTPPEETAPEKKQGPAKTAAEWLALFDASTQNPGKARRSHSYTPFRSSWELLTLLPPPAEWKALQKQIAARPAAEGEGQGRQALREIGLRLLASTLLNDEAALTAQLAEVQALAKATDPNSNEAHLLTSFSARIDDILLRQSNNPEVILGVLDRRLAAIQAALEQGQPGRAQGESVLLALPDLATIAGEEKAADFLRRALLTPGVELMISGGAATTKLAHKLVLELLPTLKTPQWRLVGSINDVAFYEALQAQFPPPAPTPPATISKLFQPTTKVEPEGVRENRQRAQQIYLMGLIAQGRSTDAAALALKMKGQSISIPSDALDALDRAGHTRALASFLHEILTQDPSLPFWSEYISLAARVGETEPMLELVRKTVAAKSTDAAQRQELGKRLYEALLAADKVDEGIKELQRSLAFRPSPAPAKTSAGAEQQEWEAANKLGEELGNRANAAIQLARIGIALDRQSLVDEGIKIAREVYGDALKLPKQAHGWALSSVEQSLSELLVDLDRGTEAEALLASSLSRAVAETVENKGGDNGNSIRRALFPLLALYHYTGRPADVLALVDKAPFWYQEDLAGLYSETVYHFGPRNISAPMGHFVASALASAGKLDEARTITYAVLDKRGDFDAAYELLAKLDGPAAIPRLDTLFSRDQFEERPLIWKARLQRDAGKLEEAEATVRQAIAIDPSDGEEGAGDRMRAYAVLADIREARGDQKEADFYREVVKAIRLSEQADLVNAAGLLSRAVAMYKEALTHFSDAYCIQSRLARQLSEAGRNEEAEVHYRRAYELMPDSFGRVESHCFGCERAFDGTRQQGIAEKIFTEVTLKTPEKPQGHYLLGYLREEQGRYSEALASFQQAVKLDPDYLNAWKQIQGTSRQVSVPTAVRDAASLAMLRLDPLNRHSGHSGLDSISDLRGLWDAVAAVQQVRPPVPAALYPFAASKAAIEKNKVAEAARRPESGRFFHSSESITPATTVGRNQMISALATLLQ